MTDITKGKEFQEEALPVVQEHETGERAFAMSIVSKQYDRDQKGYLDSTEMKMRSLDTENRGHLDADKVYEIMKELRSEQKNSMTLKKIIYALSGFAVLLALANIGTSFAAAKLAKDSQVSDNHDLVEKGTGVRLGTTAKIDIVEISELRRPFTNPEDNSDGRLLQATAQYDVSNTTGTATVSLVGAIELYSKVCSGFNAASFDAIKSGANLSASCDAFVCEGVYTKMVCDTSHMYTLMKMKTEKPAVLTNDGKHVTFYYDAYRGDNWKYDNIRVNCPLVGDTTDCQVVGDQRGLTCEKTCEVCNGGQKQYWFCGASQHCDCGVYGQCLDQNPPWECSVPATCSQ